MFVGYFLHKRALKVEQETEEIRRRTREIQRQTRKIQRQRLESQRSLEELTIQRLVAERQLHDAHAVALRSRIQTPGTESPTSPS